MWSFFHRTPYLSNIVFTFILFVFFQIFTIFLTKNIAICINYKYLMISIDNLRGMSYTRISE